MTNFKKVCLMLMALAFVFGSVACRNNAGGSDSTSSTTQSNPSTPSTPSTPSNPTPTPTPTPAKVLESVTILAGVDATDPTMLKKGMPLNATEDELFSGIVVSAKFDDSSSDVTTDIRTAAAATDSPWTVDASAFVSDSTTLDFDQEIKFSYTYDGVTEDVSFFVRIYDPTAFTGIAVKSGTEPSIASGSAFNAAGLVILKTLDDGAVVEVTDFTDGSAWTFFGDIDNDSNTADVDLVGYTFSDAEIGTFPVTVTHMMGASVGTCKFDLVVYDPNAATAIKVTQAPSISVYDYGSTALDLTGLNVEIELSNGNTVTENNVANFVAPKWTFTGYDFNSESKQSVTITYKTASTTVTLNDAFEIEVVDKVTGLTLNAPPTDTTYIQTEAFNPAGLSVTVNHLNPAKNSTFTPTSASEFTGDWELFGWDSGTPKKDLPLQVRYKKDDGTQVSVDFTVDIYKVVAVTMPMPTGKDKYYFDGESVDYLKKKYILDKSNSDPSKHVIANVELALKIFDTDGGTELASDGETYPIDNPIFTSLDVIASGDVNAAGDTFVYANGSAAVVCSFEVGSMTLSAPPITVTVVKPYTFTTTPTQATSSDFDAGVAATMKIEADVLTKGEAATTVSLSNLKFVKFGDYPQSIAKIISNVDKTTVIYGDDLHIYETPERSKEMGGMTMYLGSDGGYFVEVDPARRHTEGGDTRYDFAIGAEKDKWKDNICWFRVEPILWRLLDDKYQGKALLWSVKAIDRMPFFADSYSPDDPLYNGSKNETHLGAFTTVEQRALQGGGKSERTNELDSSKILWNSYKYSTLRAFLLGQYEPGDPQANESYKQILTGGGHTTEDGSKDYSTGEEVYLEKFGGGKGFLQRAFTGDARNLLRTADLGDGMEDYVFVLGRNELTTTVASYYFKNDSTFTAEADRKQLQRVKQPDRKSVV